MTYNERRLEMIELQNKIAKEERKAKNQSLKEILLTIFVGTTIMIMAINLLNTQLNKAVDKCSQAHDVEYCIKKLS